MLRFARESFPQHLLSSVGHVSGMGLANVVFSNHLEGVKPNVASGAIVAGGR